MYAEASINKDHLADGSVVMGDETGTLFKVDDESEIDSPVTNHRFKLVDDDGETYYTGTLSGDEDGVAEIEIRLFYWGANNAGTAALFVDGELVIG